MLHPEHHKTRNSYILPSKQQATPQLKNKQDQQKKKKSIFTNPFQTSQQFRQNNFLSRPVKKVYNPVLKKIPIYPKGYYKVMEKYLKIAKKGKDVRRGESPLKRHYRKRKSGKNVRRKEEVKEEKIIVKVQKETKPFIPKDDSSTKDRKFQLPVFAKQTKPIFLLKPSLTRLPIPSVSILSPAQKQEDRFFDNIKIQEQAKSQKNLQNEFQSKQFDYKNVSQVLNLLPIKTDDDEQYNTSYQQQTVQMNYEVSENLEEDHYYSIHQQERNKEVRNEVTKLITSQRKKDFDFKKKETSPIFKLQPQQIENDQSDYVSEYDRVMDKYSKYISNKD